MQFRAMRIGIIAEGDKAIWRERLAGLGLPTFMVASQRVQELTADSVDLLYLVAQSAQRHPGWNALRVKMAQANRQFIIAGTELTSAEIMKAARDGAAEVLDLRDTDERWAGALATAAENQSLWMELYGGAPVGAEQLLVGQSPAIAALRQTIHKIGPTDVNVLILGESGVGKEKVARALHEVSGRKNFVALNCAAIPKDLLEAELFGVEKGAFTGALKARPGLVEQAAGGTLFLDEIGEMDAALQPKLLRFLETRMARRVGGGSEYPSKARVIAATNRDLRAESAAERFRTDLFFRLAEISIHIPPLRERMEDIPLLVMTFLELANERFGKHFTSAEPALVQRMIRHPWIGNARELKSLVDRLVLLYDGPLLRAPWWDAPENPAAPASPAPATQPAAGVSARPIPNRKQKQALARRLLSESDNNYSWVAGQLGINSSTLWRWRKDGKI